jgi:hypothetical protein
LQFIDQGMTPGGGLVIKPISQQKMNALQADLLAVMNKHKVMRIDATLVPCNQNQQITINVKDPDKAEPDKDGGPMPEYGV